MFLKTTANILRYFIGTLFIVSGFVKLVDPIGTAIKLEEYFYVFGDNFFSGFEALVPAALFFSILLTTLEIVLGVALIMLYRPKITIWSILLLIIWFTILTGYSAVTGEVTDCGCFGDAVKLTPLQSFYKDIILTVGILIIFFTKNKFNSALDNKKGSMITAIATLGCLLFAYYNLAHLPVIDFRPYKIGNDIKELSNNGTAGVYEYTVKKEGQEYKFTKYPTEPGYEYVSMIEIKAPGSPTINDFNLFDKDGNEATEELLVGTHLLLISQKLDAFGPELVQPSNELIRSLAGTSIKASLIFGNSFERLEAFKASTSLVDIPAYNIDEVVIKAMIRANPGFMLIQEGKVLGKWHFNDIPNRETLESLLQ